MDNITYITQRATRASTLRVCSPMWLRFVIAMEVAGYQRYHEKIQAFVGAADPTQPATEEFTQLWANFKRTRASLKRNLIELMRQTKALGDLLTASRTAMWTTTAGTWLVYVTPILPTLPIAYHTVFRSTPMSPRGPSMLSTLPYGLGSIVGALPWIPAIWGFIPPIRLEVSVSQIMALHSSLGHLLMLIVDKRPTEKIDAACVNNDKKFECLPWELVEHEIPTLSLDELMSM
ncbi:hypothetical protein OQA88_8434 [Cercophora sp. LCS_1]